MYLTIFFLQISKQIANSYSNGLKLKNTPNQEKQLEICEGIRRRWIQLCLSNELEARSFTSSIDVAAKKLHKRDVRELEVLSELDHPHIVKLLGVVDENTDFMLILELCDRGSLRSYLKELNGQRLTDKEFLDWAEQAAKPLEYLKQKKIVHKDVKSPNYMIKAENILKLGDFGIAKNLDHTTYNATETTSVKWMAP